MKHIKRVLLMAVILVAVCIKYTNGAEGIVTTDGVRVRKEPNTSSDIITVLNKSAQVEIIEDLGEWYKIKYTWNGTYEGYMSKEFVKDASEISKATPTPETEKPAPSTPVPTTEVPIETPENIPTVDVLDEKIAIGEHVTKVSTNLYVLPTVASSVKDTIKSNSKVIVQEIAGNFAYVNCNNNYGWIKLNSLKEDINQSGNDNYFERIGYVNVTSAIIRSQATTNSEMIDSLGYNAEVTIIGEEQDFYKIKVNGIEAYMAKRLVSDTKQTTNRGIEEPRQSTPIVNEEAIVEKVPEPVQENNITTQTPEVKETPVVIETPEPVKEVPVVSVPKSSIGEQMAEMAKSFIGYKYVYGGASPSTGFDCSGLVYYICGKLGYSVNRTADDQANNGVYVEKENLEIGDLVFFSNYKTYTGIGHVGIYVGNNQFVHASTATTGVIVSSLNQTDYVKRYVTARRIG